VTRKYKHGFKAEAIGVPGAEPVSPGASDKAFSLSDESRLKARVLIRSALALQGPPTPAAAYSGVFCGALLSVEAGISRTAYLDACNEEYTRAVEARKDAPKDCLHGGPCLADGVAGDHCGFGNECGRLGCENCQQ
jgi:hypothetical protein